MEFYNNFIGIDIGKFNFVVASQEEQSIKEYANTPLGIKQFIKEHKKALPKALCILESTGGYEMGLLLTLCHKSFCVHRANTRKVKNFIRSYGNGAKTDKLDARSLSLYGTERYKTLEKYIPQSKKSYQLYELVQRRQDLKQMLVAEKNRKQSPLTEYIQESIEAIMNSLTKGLARITEEIDRLIEKDPILSKKKQVLKSIPGIGDIIANELLVLLPELGKINRREIASLVGLAPIAKDSGRLKGYRRTGHGRRGIKPLLFLASMAARNSNSHLKVYYESLLLRGKNKMVALSALMRKIIVIANAKLRDSNGAI